MKSAYLISLFSFFTLQGCTIQANVEHELSCAPDSVTVPCLLEAGQIALNDTEDDFAWASGAIELAIAYDTAGQSERTFDLMAQAISRAIQIEDVDRRGAALVEAAVALADLEQSKRALTLIEEVLNATIETEAARSDDVLAKSVIVRAAHGDITDALNAALTLPETTAREENYKAVSLRKIAGLLAKAGEFDKSESAISALTMSIPYFQAMVRVDVARTAYIAGQPERANRLLSEAKGIARDQDNGYFTSAVLRDIGYTYELAGVSDTAQTYFDEAISAAEVADSQNEKARATSRIATRLGDAGLDEDAKPVLEQAERLAQAVESPRTRGYTYYEIVGSAAFVGDHIGAMRLLDSVPDEPLGSTRSMRSAAIRDTAWGLAKHGDLSAAKEQCLEIPHAREKIQCFARITRVSVTPDMAALPRYL